MSTKAMHKTYVLLYRDLRFIYLTFLVTRFNYMIYKKAKLSSKVYKKDIEKVPTGNGYGEGLVLAGEADENVVVLCADLTESTRSQAFKEKFPEALIKVTGMAAIFVKVETNALISLAKSYLYALIVITVLMILLIGRVRIGMLSMIPNITPILITIGGMGWFDMPMDLFNMTVGSIAIGLAVDDTIHFMHNFRRYFEESGDAEKAVIQTLLTTGRAMCVTTCVLSLGFFSFMLASMNNLRGFGMLTGITIILALLSDLFLAPALMIVVNRKKKIIISH